MTVARLTTVAAALCTSGWLDKKRSDLIRGLRELNYTNMEIAFVCSYLNQKRKERST